MDTTICPWLRECFEESLRRKHFFIDENRCTHKSDWNQCPLYVARSEMNKLRETLVEMLEEKVNIHPEESGDL